MEVTVHDAGAPVPAALSPSEQIVAAAKKTAQCVGPSGKTYTLRKLTPMLRMQVFAALGSELSQNFAYLTHALTAASVSAIDGSQEPVPTTNKQILVMVERIGDDWDVVAGAVSDAFAGGAQAVDMERVGN